MSVRFNGVKHSDPATLAKLIFAALLALGSTGWSEGSKSVGPAKKATEQGLVLEDQSKGSAADVEVTRKIREDLMAERSLSTAAQNVQIITLGNTVKVKGVVSSAEEKSRVLEIANRNAMAKDVVAEITVRAE